MGRWQQSIFRSPRTTVCTQSIPRWTINPFGHTALRFTTMLKKRTEPSMIPKIICAVKDSDYNDDARLRVGLCALPRINGVTTGPYWIVAYDEVKGYALVSGGQPTIPTSNGLCKTGSGVNNSGLWIFTREQQRNDDLVNEVRAIAKSKGFDLSVLKDVDQSNC